jgi:hypothetical protein
VSGACFWARAELQVRALSAFQQRGGAPHEHSRDNEAECEEYPGHYAFMTLDANRAE